jgi:hypothetical protein
MASKLKLTELLYPTSTTAAITINSDDSVTIPTQSTTNLAYTGTLTGGTGVVNLGSGQFYKDASGNVGIGTSVPAQKLEVTAGNAQVQNTNTPSLGATLPFGLTFRGNNQVGQDRGTIAAIKPFLGSGADNDFGLVFQTQASTGGGVTTKVTLTPSGFVGIGTTPTFQLDVSHSGNTVARVTTTGTGSYGALRIENTNTNSEASIGFRDSSDSDATSWVIGKSVNAADVFGWYYGGARMTLDTSGNLLVGATSTAWTNSDAVMLAVGNGNSSFLHSSVRGDGDRFIWFVYNTNQIGSIAQSGTTGVAYVTTSDYRLKENVQPMQGALAKVAALKPVTYNWKVDGSDGQGFIAHELQAVVPDCVTGTKDAIDKDGKPQYQGVDTSFLVATLTAAIQELKAEVDALKGAA